MVFTTFAILLLYVQNCSYSDNLADDDVQSAGVWLFCTWFNWLE